MTADTTRRPLSANKSKEVDDTTFELSLEGRRHRRRVQCLPISSCLQVSSNLKPPGGTLIINKDVGLEGLEKIDDIDSLWMEYNLRRSCYGEKNPRAGQALLFIGTYEAGKGNHSFAFNLFREAASCMDGDHKCVEAGFVEAESCYKIGWLALEMGDPTKAEEYIAKSLYMHQRNELNHSRDPKSSYTVAQCLNYLGLLHTSNGDLQSTLYTLQRAADICEQIDDMDPLLLSSVLDSIGSVYCQLGDLKMALMYHKDALKIKENAIGKRHVSLVSNYKRMGVVYRERGQYTTATNCFTRAEALLTRARQRDQRRHIKGQTVGLAGELEKVHQLLATSAALYVN